MEIVETALAGVFRCKPKRHEDARGAFRETFKAHEWHGPGPTVTFVQDNQALSYKRGTLRGFHFQAPPFAQAKLVRVLQGAVQDVAVDLRAGSPTFGQHVSEVLSAENEWQLFVPPGFAHAYLTLEDDTEVLYKVDQRYHPQSEGGLLWNDPQLAVEWKVPASEVLLSEKDTRWPTLDGLQVRFA
ncbi:MAG: dTDP-4-dehydrorhamnose 3,5-epimerase [Opitutales bacterium]